MNVLNASARTLAAGNNDSMAIDWWPIDKLWQSRKEPRRYTEREIKKAASIAKRFGIRIPVVISSDGCVICHFIAVVAARRAGLEQMPVVYADDLPPAERQVLSLALNRFYELGEFDQALLGQLVMDIKIELPDLRFEEIGFEAAEVDRAVSAHQRGSMPYPGPSTGTMLNSERMDATEATYGNIRVR